MGTGTGTRIYVRVGGRESRGRKTREGGRREGVISYSSRKTRLSSETVAHPAENQSPATEGEGQDWGGRRRGEEAQEIPQEM